MKYLVHFKKSDIAVLNNTKVQLEGLDIKELLESFIQEKINQYDLDLGSPRCQQDKEFPNIWHATTISSKLAHFRSVINITPIS